MPVVDGQEDRGVRAGGCELPVAEGMTLRAGA